MRSGACLESLQSLRERRLSDVPGDSADLVSVAEEILQETFLKLIESISRFRAESSFRTWLYELAVNQALMVRRRRCQRPEEPLELHLPEFDQRGHLAKLKPNLSALAQAAELPERRELLELARSAIERLPEESRAVLVLRDLESLSSEQTALALGISDAAVRQRLHRARLMLRQELDQLRGGGHARSQ